MQVKHFVYAGIIALYGCTSNNYESRAWETAKSSTSNQNFYISEFSEPNKSC